MLGTVPLSSCLSSSRSLRGGEEGKSEEEEGDVRYREERKGGRWRREEGGLQFLQQSNDSSVCAGMIS